MSTLQNPRHYPSERYYYGWYGGQQLTQPIPQTDSQIKSELVDRLRENVHTKDHTLAVNVQSGVAVLTGDVSTVLAKRAAGDDCWDTPGVVDVSNRSGSSRAPRQPGPTQPARPAGTRSPAGRTLQPGPCLCC
jgi:hypothetical protein